MIFVTFRFCTLPTSDRVSLSLDPVKVLARMRHCDLSRQLCLTSYTATHYLNSSPGRGLLAELDPYYDFAASAAAFTNASFLIL